MTAGSRRGAWALVLLVLVGWLVAFVLSGAGVAPRAGGGEPLGGRSDGGGSGGGGSDGGASGGGGSVGGGSGDGEAGDGGAGDDSGAESEVVLIGIPGLTWDVVDEATTPTIARLAQEGGAGALVLRGTHEVTCAADAWLTVGAGQRAATDVEGCRDADFEATPTSDRPSPVLVDEIVRGGRVDPDVWDRWAAAAEERSLGTELGTLAALAEAAGTCVAAYGSEAVLGAAAADGTAAVAVRADEGSVAAPAPGRPSAGSTPCRIHLVSAPPVQPPPGADEPAPLAPGQTEGVVPAVPAAEIDAAVAEIEAGLPSGTALVIAGLGHTSRRAEAMALVVHPVGTETGGLSPASTEAGASLSSGSTRQRGLVQLTDLTPTLLRLAGVDLAADRPASLGGQPVTVVDGGDQVRQARDLASGVSLAKSSVVPVLGVLAVLVIPLLMLAGWRRRGRVAAGVATVAMAVPVATFLAGLVPWWRAGSPVVVLTLVVAGLAVLVASLGWAGPWRRDPLAPAAVVAAVTLLVLGVDMMWSARLGLVSVFGLQPVTAGRFYGQGNVGFGIALGAFLVLAGTVVSWLTPTAAPRAPSDDDSAGQLSPSGFADHHSEDGAAEHHSQHGATGRRSQDGSAEHHSQDGPAGHRSQDGSAGPRHYLRSVPAAAAVALLGGALTIVGAAPWGGADFGGVPALVVATGLIVMTTLGLRWSVGSLLALAALGLVVAAAAMVLDWSRGPESRTHLGNFVQQVIDGEALGVVTRKLDQSLGILITYPLSWLAVVALMLVAWVVVRTPIWSASLWRHPGLYPASVAGLVAIALAWALNDSGIAVVALALTMLIAAALSVLAPSRSRG